MLCLSFIELDNLIHLPSIMDLTVGPICFVYLLGQQIRDDPDPWLCYWPYS